MLLFSIKSQIERWMSENIKAAIGTESNKVLCSKTLNRQSFCGNEADDKVSFFFSFNFVCLLEVTETLQTVVTQKTNQLFLLIWALTTKSVVMYKPEVSDGYLQLWQWTLFLLGSIYMFLFFLIFRWANCMPPTSATGLINYS